MKDLTGKKYSRLTVVGLVPNHKALWLCKCDCGNEITVNTSLLESGHNKSCGCLNNEKRKLLPQYTTTHGKTNTRLYSVWRGIKDRCNNPNVEHYDRYGGRGIGVCDEWDNSFESFYEWAIGAGYNENLSGKEQSIDRIDVNKNYSPDNCRWIAQKYQARNVEKTAYITENGKEIPVVEFCENHKISDTKYVRRKVIKGQTASEILFDWNMIHNRPEQYMTLKEAANHYNVSTLSIHHWVKDGKLKGIVSGKRLYILRGQEVKRRKDRDSLGRFIPGYNT